MGRLRPYKGVEDGKTPGLTQAGPPGGNWQFPERQLQENPG